MEGAAMIDGIKYHGADRFIVTKDRLKELLEKSIACEVCEWVVGDNWDGWELTSYALDDMYPGRGVIPYDVADSFIAELSDPFHI